MRLTPWRTSSRKPFAARSIAEVMSVSAGPPSGGLYLKPPSSGGLCDGVITTPSARPELRPLLAVRMACEIGGVGVDHHLDAVGREYFESAYERRFRQRVGIDADEQRPGNIDSPPVIAD